MWSSQPHLFLCVFLFFKFFNVLYILNIFCSVEILWFHIVTPLFFVLHGVLHKWRSKHVWYPCISMSKDLLMPSSLCSSCTKSMCRWVGEKRDTRGFISFAACLCSSNFVSEALPGLQCQPTPDMLQPVSASWLSEWFIRLVMCCGKEAQTLLFFVHL